ncbi:MAG: hypothetical protein A3K19_28900 [Lentisphaerae bacterium RIFOXYB12_FULL_65_16]|nr:MAG: hypothetical protein A3K18_25485 [Lentisphaerae bacterium RIFOXYA12_64_32]OGV88313.1 MAG: hypothetical protein A3K19_28900 [Lentisphaerae bacterium RIFOXYB12_FULL_65_16]
MAFAGLALVSLLATGAASAAPALFPAPQQCAVGEQRLPLPAEVVIAVGENASPTELYAAETLVRDLAERSQCQAKLARPGEPGADSATVVLGQAGANPALWELVAKLLKEPLPAMPATAAPEGYTLRVTAVEGRPLAIVQGVDASGTLSAVSRWSNSSSGATTGSGCRSRSRSRTRP